MKFTLSLLILLACSRVMATNWFLSANSAWPATSPGDNVFITNTWTSPLAVSSGGSAGNPVTLIFTNAAKFSAATWTGNVISGAPYLTIDGGSNGLIEATANGTGLAYSNNINGVYLNAANGAIVKNLTIRNLYVNISGDGSGSGSGVYISGCSSVTVTNCVLHDMGVGAAFVYYAGDSNLLMTYCTASNCNWGGSAGDGNSSGTLVGMTVDHCHFLNWQNWDDTADNNHHNGFYTFGTAGWASNIVYSSNYVGPGYGAHSTSGLFTSDNVVRLTAYNNIFDASDGTAPANGLLNYGCSTAVATTNLILNNTFIGTASMNALAVGGGVGSTTEFICLNNEFYTSNGVSIVGLYANLTLVSNTNNFSGLTSSYQPFAYGTGGSPSYYTLTTWNGLGYDTHSTTNNALLNSSWIPQSGSPLIGAGLNLTGLGITGLDTDYSGNSRPSSGAWDIGANEYESGGGQGGSCPPWYVLNEVAR